MSNFSPSFVQRLVESAKPTSFPIVGNVVSTLTKELGESMDGRVADIDLFASFNVELPSGHDLWSVRQYKYGDSQLQAVSKMVRKAKSYAKDEKIRRLAEFYADPMNMEMEASAFDLPEFCTPVVG